MVTTTREKTKTISMPSAPEETVPERVTQRKQADSGRFRLQVDRQTKASYATYEAAETAGLGVKKENPLVQVAIYDGVESVNKNIEFPEVIVREQLHLPPQAVERSPSSSFPRLPPPSIP